MTIEEGKIVKGGINHGEPTVERPEPPKGQNPFAPKNFTEQAAVAEETAENKPKYSHNFSEEEVLRVQKEFELLSKRDLVATPVTLDEFRLIVVPHLHISRTEVFNLAVSKEKPPKAPRVQKEKPPKAPREKRMTKKEKEAKLNSIIMKMATGNTVTPEEQEFFSSCSIGLDI